MYDSRNIKTVPLALKHPSSAETKILKALGSEEKVFLRGFSCYCQQTSLHGWQYIDSEQGWFRKIFWFIIVFMSVALSVYFLVVNTKAYLKATTVTSIASTTASLNDLLFPSLYICNVNQVTKSFLRNLGVEDDDAAANLLFDEFLTGSEKSELNAKNQKKMNEMLEQMKVKYDWNEYTRFYNISSQNCSDMIIRVIWKSNENYTETFFDAFKSSTDYGACCLITPYLDLENPTTKAQKSSDYTGEQYRSIPKGLTRNGIQNGLKVMVDVENYDYAFFERGAKGFRVAIADGRDKPVINQNGFYVSPGSETLVAMTPTILNTTQEAMERFRPKDRNCYTDEEFKFKHLKYDKGFRYSMRNCLYESALEVILSNCSCIPNFASFKLDVPDELDVCRGNELDCAIHMINNLGNENMGLNQAMNDKNKSMTCLQRCEMQDQNLISTQSDYPNWQTFTGRNDFCLILHKVIRVCENPIRRIALENRYRIYDEFYIPCSTILQSSRIKEICNGTNVLPDQLKLDNSGYKKKLVDFLYKYASKNIAILKIFFRDPYYTLINKDEQMSTVSWIGNTGGLVGLCMGLSFVSLFEMVYHGFNFFLKSCKIN